MSYLPIEQTNPYKRAKALADGIWHLSRAWDKFAQFTTGKQLVNAVDSVGANLAEGDGRYGGADALHFFVIARGSLREAGCWIDVALDRGLIDPAQSKHLRLEVEVLRRLLNGLIQFRRENKNKNYVREAIAYGTGVGAGCEGSSGLTPPAFFTEEA